MKYKLLAILITAYALLLRYTSKVVVVGEKIPQQFWDKGEPVILALWHGRLLMLPYLCPRPYKFNVLASTHKDGLIAAAYARFMGLEVVAGSSKQGGASAARNLMKKAKVKENLVITPDAPPNKVFTCAKGVAGISKLTGLPVIPCAISFKYGKQLNTKDKFIIPRPFNVIYFHYGQAILPEKDNIKTINQAMVKLTEKADIATNHPKWSQK